MQKSPLEGGVRFRHNVRYRTDARLSADRRLRTGGLAPVERALRGQSKDCFALT